MNNQKKATKKGERKEKVMNWKKKWIILIRFDVGIEEEYQPNADGPVYLHYMPDGCSFKGATMHRMASTDALLADQVIKEIEAKLQIQSKRVLGHPLKTKRNVIVLDSLETGSLSIYEPIEESTLSIVHSSDGCNIDGANLIGRISINILPEEKTVVIDALHCKYGYEDLANPMIEQIQYFVDFYEEFDNLEFADL